MQWSPDRNGGFSRADPASLVLPPIMDPLYGFQAINVEAQARDPHSLLNWTRRMLAVRKRYKAFGRGSLEFLKPGNRRVLAFVRRYQDECVLVVANLAATLMRFLLMRSWVFRIRSLVRGWSLRNDGRPPWPCDAVWRVWKRSSMPCGS